GPPPRGHAAQRPATSRGGFASPGTARQLEAGLLGTGLVRALAVEMDDRPVHDGAMLDLDDGVADVARDARARLQLEKLVGLDRSFDSPVDDHMGGANLALDPGIVGKHEQAGLARLGQHPADHLAVDTQAAPEAQVPLDHRAAADQAVDRAVRLRRLASEHRAASMKPPTATVTVAPGRSSP